MPQFPSISTASTAALDAGSDEPRLARPSLKTTTDNVNSIITTFSGNTIVVTDQEQGFGSQQYANLATLGNTTPITWNVSQAQVAQAYLTANTSLSNPTNIKAGATYILFLRQTGNVTLSFGNAYVFVNNVTPAVSGGAGVTNVLSFVSDGTRLYGSLGRF
jgi:hypothetical protein